MKKWYAIWIVWVCLLISPSALAAGLPEQTNLITDPIQLFTSEDKTKIEQKLSGQPYEVIVLTASELDDQQGFELANQAYDEWELNPDQLMLVIVTNPNSVHLVFDNIAIKEAIAKSGAKDPKGLLDRTFVPYASKGKLADGVISVSDMINQLMASPVVAPSASAAPSTVPATAPSVDRTEAANPSSAPASSNKLYGIIGALLITIVLILLANFFFYSLKNRREIKRLYRSSNELYHEAAALLNRMITSDILRDLEHGFYQGETKKIIAEMDAAVLKLNKQSSELLSELQNFKIGWFKLSPLKESIEQILEKVTEFHDQTDQQHQRMEKFEKTAKEVTEKINNAKQFLIEASHHIDQLVEKTSFPLNFLRKKWQQASELVSKADKLDEFDVLRAKPIIKEAEPWLDFVQTAIHEMDQLIARFNRLRIEIQQTFDSLQVKVSDEQLKLVDENPFDILKKTEPLLSQISAILQEGNTPEVHRNISKVEQVILAAKTAVEDMIRHRDESASIVRLAEKTMIEYADFDQVYDVEMNKLQDKYAQIHWKDQPKRYKRIKDGLADIRSGIREIEALTDLNIQRYRDAHRKAAQVKTVIQSVEKNKEECLSLYSELETTLNRLENEFISLQEKFQDIMSQLQREGVPLHLVSEWGEMSEDWFEQTKLAFDVKPFQLQTIGKCVDNLAESVKMLDREAGRCIDEKQKAELAYSQMENTFKQAVKQYRAYIRVSRYKSRYRQAASDIRTAIDNGYYAEALDSMMTVHYMFKEMSQAYSYAYAEIEAERERKRERERARERERERERERQWQREREKSRRESSSSSSWFSSSSSNSSSSSSSSRSSGSSSWGSSSSSSSSSGRDSGSSSWGSSSSSGRDSGSSSWGSSNGRGGGSSKW